MLLRLKYDSTKYRKSKELFTPQGTTSGLLPPTLQKYINVIENRDIPIVITFSAKYKRQAYPQIIITSIVFASASISVMQVSLEGSDPLKGFLI